MDLLKPKSATIREKRLQAISAYYGKAEQLLYEHAEGQFVQRVRTFSQDVPGDIIYALRLISTIQNSAIVVHGASGCAVNRLSQYLFDYSDGQWAITNMNERDSIMGSDVKLREAIKQVYKLHSPEIIFVVSTPVVAINNDDIESIVEELKEELDLPIVPVYTDGFRSKIGSTGYDMVSHSITKHILSPRKGEPVAAINLLSISENPEDLNEACQLLSKLDLKLNVFPRFSSLRTIKKLKDASFSVSINPDEARYPGTILESRYQIPYIQPVIPVGIENTAQWLNAVASVTGRLPEAQTLIIREKDRLAELLTQQNLTKKRKVFVSLPPSLAFGVAGLLKELGQEVAGLKLLYIDQSHIQNLEQLKADHPEFSFLVGEGQLFEEENVLQKIKPEIYIGQSSDFSAAVRNGIPVINLDHCPILGFAGAGNLALEIRKTTSNRSFQEILKVKIGSRTYTSDWLKKSPNWFIKQEVK
jgi:nitrogenase molybdenum-cofactor synthesis protein NifE